jgi:predicted adenine nucleotide alpha hydrolase (AANH) superfamily ATPase
MRILLHICCAPCALYTVDRLIQGGHKVEGFFYNPNIAPLAEYKLRRQAVSDMAKRMNLKVVYRDEVWQQYRAVCSQPALIAAKSQRCANCWRMRLSETANTAAQEHYEAFTTSLLISPYQGHEEIRLIGKNLAGEAKVGFYYEDFRPGFRQSQAMAKEQGLYRQKYCGCLPSIEDMHGTGSNKTTSLRGTCPDRLI